MKQGHLKNKNVINVIYNAGAIFLPIAAIQFLIYPEVERELGGESYGLMITLLGIVNVIGNMCGSSILNIRLIKNVEYCDRGYNGDFSTIALKMTFIGTILSYGLALYYVRNMVTALSVSILTIMTILRFYLEFEFRINMDYKKIMISNILLLIGYILGLALFKNILVWDFVFIMGYGINLVYLLCKNKAYMHEFYITPFYHQTFKETIIMSVALLADGLTTHLDTLLIFPMLGATSVSIYYVSALLGKMVSMGVSPLTGMLLSYLSTQKTMSYAFLKKTVFGAVFLGGLGFLGVLIFTPFFLTSFYPDLYSSARPYVAICSLTAILYIGVVILRAFILRFYRINLQMKINCIALVFYAVIGCSLTFMFGLIGFCWAALLTNIVRIILLYKIVKHYS